MSVRPFFQGVYSIWLFVAEKKKNVPKVFYAVFHLKEPSLSPLPSLVGFVLYKVIVIFLFCFNCKCNFCRWINPCQSSCVEKYHPFREHWSCLLYWSIPPGGKKKLKWPWVVPLCAVSMTLFWMWHYFLVLMFPGSYYLLSFSKADGTATIAWQPVVLRANELKRLDWRDRMVLRGLWEPGRVVCYAWGRNKAVWETGRSRSRSKSR